MQILLLGASGLLGHNILKELVRRGEQVTIVTRKPIAETFASNRQVTIRYGSILDPKTLDEAAQESEAIINCAGTTDMTLLHYEDYLPVNRDLCSTLLDTINNHGIKTLIHISTANTIGNGDEERPGEEQNEIGGVFAASYYAQSKYEGERMLQHYAREHSERHIVILNPGFMIGAYDTKPSSGQLLLAGYRRPLMVAPKGGKSFVAVADVAVAACNALNSGENGQRYLITGESLSLKDFYALQAATCGYKQRIVEIPNWMVRLAGKAGDVIRRSGIKSQLATHNVEQLLIREYYSNAHAIKDLGLPQTPIWQAIEEFYRWREGK